MSNSAHVEVLTTDPSKWNAFRSSLKVAVPDLSYTAFQGLNLSGCDLSSAILSHTTFDDVDLSNTNLERSRMDHSVLRFCELNNTNFRSAHFAFGRIASSRAAQGSDFSGARLNHAHLSHCDFSFCCFFRTVFEGSLLDSVTLDACDCRYACFTGASISNASMILTNCMGCDFDVHSVKNTDLKQVNFFGASTFLSSDLNAGRVGTKLVAVKKPVDPQLRLLLE